jgi:hypothetical protein
VHAAGVAISVDGECPSRQLDAAEAECVCTMEYAPVCGLDNTT